MRRRKQKQTKKPTKNLKSQNIYVICEKPQIWKMAAYWLEVSSSDFESRALSTMREEASSLCIPQPQTSTSLTVANSQGTKTFPVGKSQMFFSARFY